MKLAEALLLRSEYRHKLDNIQQRIMQNIKVQEGEKPFADPAELIAEYMAINDSLCALVKQINDKNAKTVLPDGQTIADALAFRDMLAKKRNFLSMIIAVAGQPDFRKTRTEVKSVVTVDLADIQKQIDAVSKEYRILDTMIQGQNWTTELE